MNNSPAPFFKSIGVFFVKIGFMAFFYLLLTFLTSGGSGDVLNSLASLLATILTLFVFMSMEKRKLKALNLALDYKDILNVRDGLIKGFLYSAILVLLLLVTKQYQISGLIMNHENIGKALLASIITILLEVLSEELLFRGYILSYLKEKYSVITAITLSSLIYAATYLFNTETTVVVFFNAFLIACILSLLVLKYNSLLLAVAAHFAYRIIFDFFLNFRDKNALINFNFKNVELLSGGMYGIDGGLVFTVAALIVIVLLLRNNKSIGKVQFSFINRLVGAGMAFVLLIGISANLLVWMPGKIVNDSTTIKNLSRFDKVNDYKIQWNLNTSDKTMHGIQEISYINNSKDNLKELYFHVYPNAFSVSGGGMDMSSVRVKGIETVYKLEGDDASLLYIPLASDLVPGARVDISMEYDIRIPARNTDAGVDRFGYGINTINMGNCFPIAAVYENGKWDTHPYDKKGDAFYSETSNFDVTIKAPKNFIIAPTGEIIKESDEGKDKQWWVAANGVRDFAFVASDKFNVVEADVEGTKLRSYAFNKYKAEKVLKISEDALRIYNKRFGEYPYSTCSVVETDLDGGMEYPNMVMIESSGYNDVSMYSMLNTALYGSAIGELEFTVVHELAHQWWYGLVGDDEYREAWLDEPLAQYSSVLYFKDKYGSARAEQVYNNSMVALYKFGGRQTLESNSMKRSLDEFSENDYYELIYNKGAMMFNQLRREIGDDKFNKFTSLLYSKYKFKVIHGQDLVNTASEAAGKDMTEFFRKWTETDYAE